jgi:hypothetical protein
MVHSHGVHANNESARVPCGRRRRVSVVAHGTRRSRYLNRCNQKMFQETLSLTMRSYVRVSEGGNGSWRSILCGRWNSVEVERRVYRAPITTARRYAHPQAVAQLCLTRPCDRYWLMGSTDDSGLTADTFKRGGSECAGGHTGVGRDVFLAFDCQVSGGGALEWRGEDGKGILLRTRGARTIHQHISMGCSCSSVGRSAAER